MDLKENPWFGLAHNSTKVWDEVNKHLKSFEVLPIDNSDQFSLVRVVFYSSILHLCSAVDCGNHMDYRYIIKGHCGLLW